MARPVRIVFEPMLPSCFFRYSFAQSPPFLMATVIALRTPFFIHNLFDVNSRITKTTKTVTHLGVSHRTLVDVAAFQFVENEGHSVDSSKISNSSGSSKRSAQRSSFRLIHGSLCISDQ